jgi:hypothetical protein
MLRLGQGIAKGVDVAAMSKEEAGKFLDDQKDVLKYFPTSKQVALIDKVDVNVEMVKKLVGMKMNYDFVSFFSNDLYIQVVYHIYVLYYVT